MRCGPAGLAATTASIALTLATGLAGPSVMEPALPGAPGRPVSAGPPWSFSLHLPPWLAVGLAAAALAAGTVGLGLSLHAVRRGWQVSPRAVLVGGLIAAAAITVAPPFGSSDQLSYAAYGRMVTTGHDPYTTTPAMLARLGDPVARAVQDWRHSASVYGGLGTGAQALASWLGGDSARLTVFVLSLLNLAAFAGTGLLLHLLTRRSRPRQLRAGLLWVLNPLLLQVLVAGGHIDSLAIVFAVAAVAIFALGIPDTDGTRLWSRRIGVAAAAGATAGLAFAVKLSFLLVAVGLIAAAGLAQWPGPRPRNWRPRAVVGGGVAVGFTAVAVASLVPWGLGSVGPALRAGSFVSIGSPWRTVRFLLRLLVGEGDAGTVVKVGAIVLAVAVPALFAAPLAGLAARLGDRAELNQAGVKQAGVKQAELRQAGVNQATLNQATLEPAAWAALVAACAFVIGFAWLVAWPYVLPWYDGLAWALLALLPWPGQRAPGQRAPGQHTRARSLAGPASRAAPWAGAPWAVLDWLVLADAAALAFGYLPARGIVMPASLAWLRTVVRTGITPMILLAVTVVLVMCLWPRRPALAGLRRTRTRT